MGKDRGSGAQGLGGRGKGAFNEKWAGAKNRNFGRGYPKKREKGGGGREEKFGRG